MAIVFREEKPGLYDLFVNGRIAEYDVGPEDFRATLRRRRVTVRANEHVYVEDLTGYRTRLT